MSSKEPAAGGFACITDAEAGALRAALRAALAGIESAETNHSAILGECREMGANLSTSRVRVGFTRGHLMEIVVLIPLDVAGSDQLLQEVAEAYLERALGVALLDRWVACVDVDRIARSRGLMMVQDSQQAVNYPLCQVVELVHGGIAAVEAEIPTDAIAAASVGQEGWTALEARELAEGLLPLGSAERIFASTCQPEALKAIMEGMPFSSARFCRGKQLLAWVGCEGGAGEDRLGLSERLLMALEGAESCPWRVVGTGFGARGNYVDIWLSGELDCLELLARCLASVAAQVHFGYYDDPLRDWRFVMERGMVRAMAPGAVDPGAVDSAVSSTKPTHEG